MDRECPLAVGVDIVEIDRVAALLARHPLRFAGRYFTPGERADCGGRPDRYAARWAAKEAVAKALGTGLGAVRAADVEVVRLPSGAPVLRLHGSAAERAGALGLDHWSVSLSHSRTHAVAAVVATATAQRYVK
jgi:holo-[acyl-carrier protein] synthase